MRPSRHPENKSHVKLRHLVLILQDVVKDGRLKVRRIDGEKNIADHMTKPKSGKEMTDKIADAGGEIVWKT